MGVLVFSLHGGAVPAVVFELEFALVNGHVDSLDGGHDDVRVPVAQRQLLLTHSRENFAHGGAHWKSLNEQPAFADPEEEQEQEIEEDKKAPMHRSAVWTLGPLNERQSGGPILIVTIIDFFMITRPQPRVTSRREQRYHNSSHNDRASF